MEHSSRRHETIDDVAREARRLVAQLTAELAAFDLATPAGRQDLQTGRALLADAGAAARGLADAIASTIPTNAHPIQTVDSE